MNGKRISLKRNFIMNALLTVSSVIFPIITFPYASRILLPEGTGKVSFAISLITYFIMFSELGVPTYGIRAVAKVRDDKEALSRLIQELMLINIIMSIVSYAALFIACMTIGRLRADMGFYMMLSVALIVNALGTEWLYKGLEQYSYISIRSIIFKAIALVAIFLFVRNREDYVFYGLISIFANVGPNLVNICFLRKYIRPVWPSIRRSLTHLKPIIVFFAMSCATTIYTNLDTVMLGFMTSNTEVGYYNASVKIKTVLVSFVTSLGAVVLPRASYYVERGEMSRFWDIIRKAFIFVIGVSVPLVIIFIRFAGLSIDILSGPAYAGAVVPMQIIMPTLLLIGLSNITGIQIFIPMGYEKMVLYSEITGAVTDVVINLMLIPKYGAAGAAAGTLAAEAVVLLFQLIVLRKILINRKRQESIDRDE